MNESLIKMVLADALQMHLEIEDYLTCAALQACIEKIETCELIVADYGK